jgi:rubrerythrin
MTTKISDQPDRATIDRASHLFNATTTLDWDQALAEARRQLATEAEAEAEQHEKARAITDSMARMWSCACCGANAGPGARDGLCPTCRPVVAQVVAERNAAQAVGEHTRRQLAERYVTSLAERT